MKHDTTSGRGAVLSTGRPLADCFDLDRRSVALEVLTDPGLYELEMERIFARAWVGIAHTSEIPAPGDFVMRHLGSDPVIVTRSPSGDVDVLLNVCTHRGMQVCRAETGNATKFRCPYHGWVFGTNGEFLAAPFEKEMYGDALDKPSLGLQRARTGVYAGIVSATWDEHAPTLDDYLGDIRWYLDIMFNRSDAGMEVVGSPQRMIMDANWKSASEQWAGDGYHTMSLHRSMADLGYANYERGSWAVNVGTNGHGLRCSGNPTRFWAAPATDGPPPTYGERLRTMPPPGLTVEMVPEVERHLDDAQIRALCDTPPVVGQLFPNFFVWHSYGLATGGGLSAVATLHATVPMGPNQMELLSWVVWERDAPDAIKEQVLASTLLMSGSTGFIEQDDVEAWPSLQKSARGFMGRRHALRYPAILGLQKSDDWSGPGLVYDGFSKDDNQWNWWLRYRELMEAPS